jgi:methylthioribose-1-phosphate isomerase
VRTVDWAGDHLVIIDQTLLPAELRLIELRSVDEVIGAIRRLAVRGAPAIGVTGGLGVALAALVAYGAGDGPARVRTEAARLREARPTAVNLAWAVDRVSARIDEGPAAVLAEAIGLLEADIAADRALGARGADLVQQLVPGRVAVHTHCNTGALAAVEWGTGLGVVRCLHERGAVREVYADETRPLLQGARLTAFELEQLGIPYRVVVDGAGPSVIARGLVDVVIVGADRVTANGDVVNKIGTYPLALAASRAAVPFLVAAPESTLDPATPDGAHVTIEERDPGEVLAWGGVRSTPAGAAAFNPAFDVTPAELVTAIVTEARVIRPAEGEGL